MSSNLEKSGGVDRLQLFYSAFQFSTDPIIITDRQGIIIEANKAFSDVFGWRPEEIIGKTTNILRSSQTSAEFYRTMWAMINEKGEWKGEIINRCKDGTEIPVFLSITPVFEDGTLIGYMGVEIDISKQKEMEKQLRREKEFSESLIDTANNLIVSLDLQGGITMFNKKCEELTGYRKEEVLGKSWFEVFIPARMQAEVDDEFQAILDGKRPSVFENPILVKNGEERIISWNNTAIRDEHRQVVGALAIGQDVTEHKKLEQQAIQAERLAAIGKMAAKVAHEIRNPLSSISLNAELLGDEIEEAGNAISEEAATLLQSIITEVDRVANLTEEYLQFSRLPVTHLMAGDLVAVVRDAVTFIEPEANSARVNIIIDATHPMPALAFDAVQIRRVLLNLIRNAIEAMPKGGEIHVGIESTASDVVLRVADTGHGVPPDNLEKVFAPFYTTKELGTGLGLAIVKQIVEEHGGSIRCDSNANQGTVFTVVLPRGRR